MAWYKCSNCGRLLRMPIGYSLTDCICGNIVEIKLKKDDGIDPRLIHDAVLPEVVGDCEAAEGSSVLEHIWPAFWHEQNINLPQAED